MPISVHWGNGSHLPGAGTERFDTHFMVHAVGHPFEQMIAFAAVVCGGVLDEFPRLRVGFLEAGCGWAAYWVERLDEHFERRSREMPKMTKTATEVRRRRQPVLLVRARRAADPGGDGPARDGLRLLRVRLPAHRQQVSLHREDHPRARRPPRRRGAQAARRQRRSVLRVRPSNRSGVSDRGDPASSPSAPTVTIPASGSPGSPFAPAIRGGRWASPPAGPTPCAAPSTTSPARRSPWWRPGPRPVRRSTRRRTTHGWSRCARSADRCRPPPPALFELWKDVPVLAVVEASDRDALGAAVELRFASTHPDSDIEVVSDLDIGTARRSDHWLRPGPTRRRRPRPWLDRRLAAVAERPR